jgi:hypothetical protein
MTQVFKCEVIAARPIVLQDGIHAAIDLKGKNDVHDLFLLVRLHQNDPFDIVEAYDLGSA